MKHGKHMKKLFHGEHLTRGGGFGNVGASVAFLRRPLKWISFNCSRSVSIRTPPHFEVSQDRAPLFGNSADCRTVGKLSRRDVAVTRAANERRVTPGLGSSHVKRNRAGGNPPCTPCYTMGRRVGSVAERLRMNRFQYQEYLKSDHWQNLRLRKLKTSKVCFFCKSPVKHSTP